MTDYSDIKPDPTLGLCLGGGGGLGFLHLGLFETLEELGIRPGVVAGTSAGSIMGAFYASGKSAGEIRKIVEDFQWTNIMAPSLSQRGLFSPVRLREFLRRKVGKINIKDLPIRLKIAAVNIIDGTFVGFAEGPLAKCLTAASAVPGAVEPVRIGDGLYYDAGGIYNLPLELFAGEGVKTIIAGNTIGQYALMPKPASAQEVFYQAYLIRTMHLTAMRIGPKKWQGYNGEKLIFIDYKIRGLNPTSLKECAQHIEETRELSRMIIEREYR
ncbi:MAG: patatin-like phospholipase family protein [bacterium]|nr:patatin-like phospholipase family protein [bacterium]